MTIIFNGQPREISADATVAALLDELELPGSRVAVEVNYELVPRAEHAAYTLKDGDRLEIVTFVGGG